ncbi:MAG: threonine/serine exporter family protein [Eubacterium sp.]
MTTTELITCAMEIGDMLLENGAEIYRVEESMYRICKAYGAEDPEIFAVPTTIIITVKGKPGEAPITLTKRIYSRGTNLYKVDLLNALSREMCATLPTYEAVNKRIETIKHFPSYSLFKQVLGFSFIAFFFTLLFKGTLQDASCAFIIGALLKLVLYTLGRIETNAFFENVITGAITALVALFFVKSGFAQSMDKIIIGTIMSLVPGLAITNSMRDIIAGDLLAGITKATEALLIGAGIAVGAAIPLTFLQPFLGV